MSFASFRKKWRKNRSNSQIIIGTRDDQSSTPTIMTLTTRNRSRTCDFQDLGRSVNFGDTSKSSDKQTDSKSNPSSPSPTKRFVQFLKRSNRLSSPSDSKDSSPCSSEYSNLEELRRQINATQGCPSSEDSSSSSMEEEDNLYGFIPGQAWRTNQESKTRRALPPVPIKKEDISTENENLPVTKLPSNDSHGFKVVSDQSTDSGWLIIQSECWMNEIQGDVDSVGILKIPVEISEKCLIQLHDGQRKPGFLIKTDVFSGPQQFGVLPEMIKI